MNDFLERFKSSTTPDQQQKFLIQINAEIDAYAKFTDQLKKQYRIWDKETEDLCILRDLIISQMKENR